MWLCRRPIAAGLLALLLTLVLGFLAVAWRIVSYSDQSFEASADAAVTLGAAAWGNKPSPVYRERINEAISLYKKGLVRYLIFTGGTPESSYPSEGWVGREFAIKHGVPETAVLEEQTSRTTQQNLANAQQLMVAHGIKTVLLVSDPLHMYRAMSIAKDMGLPATPAPTSSSRFQSLTSRAKFLWRETWLYLEYWLFRSPN